MRPLSVDLSQKSLCPYFLWDEDLSVDDRKERLREEDWDLVGREPIASPPA